MSRLKALITGASAGIGKDFAFLLAERGYDLILIARREEKLQDIAKAIDEKYGAQTHIIVKDLELKQSYDEIISEIKSNGFEISYLVNNAGYGLPGTFSNTSWDAQSKFLEIMLNGPTKLCHEFVPLMQKQGFGRVINIASLAGIVPSTAGHTLYGAVKAYLIKMSQSLNQECLGTGVNVTALCPGFTYTEFHDVNGTREQMKSMPKFLWQDSYSVVLEGFNSCEANKCINVTGRFNKFIAVMSKILPDNMALGLVKSQTSKYRRLE